MTLILFRMEFRNGERGSYEKSDLNVENARVIVLRVFQKKSFMLFIYLICFFFSVVFDL